MNINNPFDFTGKTIILTGAAGGLGRPISIAFAKAGAEVAICDLNEQGLAVIVDEIKAFGGHYLTRKVDLCSQGEVEDFVRMVHEKFQKVDVLVNVVGGLIRKLAVEYPLEEWERVVDMNLKACWLSCQAVGRIMVGQRRGRIINFTSNAGTHGIQNNAAYGPAKAGVIALTRVLAVEWGPYGVSTNALAPGFVATPINADILTNPKAIERFVARMPLGGQILPDDAPVGPTLFLASDAARWINGHTLYVDAGFNIT